MNITSVAFSPDGTTIARASSNGTVQLWDANTGQSQAILEAHGVYQLQAGLIIHGRKMLLVK